MTSIPRTKLPVAQLAEEVHFACLRQTWNEINDRLRGDAPNEACAFVLTYPSRGYTRVTAILRDVIWPNAGDVEQSPEKLEISSDYISRAIDATIDAGDSIGLTLVHTHPNTKFGPGYGRFSPRDDWYEHRLFPSIVKGRHSALSGSIVLGPNPRELEARIWWDDDAGVHTQPAQICRIVGPEVDFIETPHSRWKDHPDPELMDRSTRIWGEQGRRKLQNIRVGVIGVGGTGSIAVFSLAQMGVGGLRYWDDDVIKKENLHRMLGVTKEMVTSNKAKALEPILKSIATANPFTVDAIPEKGTSREGLKKLRDCDVAFSCVDKFGPRVPLNQLAYSHLIPIIDIASWLHPTSTGIIDAIMTHAHVWSPGIPCAWCRGTLTSARLTREAQGDQRDIHIRYGLRPEETDNTEPSVLPLNLAGVGLALLEFMQVALKITPRTPNDLKLILPEWELDESDLPTRADCDVETDMAKGDAVEITPVE